MKTKSPVAFVAVVVSWLLMIIACHFSNWPHAPGPPAAGFAGATATGEDPDLAITISETIYTPRVHRFSVDSCKTMFPPDDVGSLCDYYDGIGLPDGCADAYHMENQRGAFMRASMYRDAAERVDSRKVCHLNTARGERGAGLECETGRTP